MHLYLIRHGQSYVNLEDWDGGWIDAGLTDLGQRQAAALASWLPTYLQAIDVLYTSTMKRALETAAHLESVYGLAAIPDHRIREIGNNRIDHSPWPEEEWPEDEAWHDFWSSERPFDPVAAHLQAESMMHFKTRVGGFLGDILNRHHEQTVVVVCHGGVLDMVFDYVFNVGPWRRCETWTTNTGIVHLEYVEHPGREVWRLHCHNRVEHLQGIS